MRENEQKTRTEKILADKSRRILKASRLKPAKEQLDGLRRRGIIDAQGHIVHPVNGTSKQNGTTHSNS